MTDAIPDTTGDGVDPPDDAVGGPCADEFVLAQRTDPGSPSPPQAEHVSATADSKKVGRPGAIPDSNMDSRSADSEIKTSEKPVLANVPPSGVKGDNDLIYQGSVSLWMGWWSFLGAGLACLMGMVALAMGYTQDPGWVKKSLVVFGTALLVAGGIMIPYVILSIRCLRYTVTSNLIEREKGIIVRRVDSLDLGRVKDVELRQNIFQRILKIGTIEIYSSDRSDPCMLMEDIPMPRPVYESLRNAVVQLSQRRGIISMDR